MLDEKITYEKEKYQDFKVSELGVRLARMQRICESLKIPVLIIVEGWESSGRGYVINDLVRELNRKFVDVDVFNNQSDEERKYPFLRDFWIKIPRKGYLKIFDRSFYYDLMNDLEMGKSELKTKIEFINSFEKALYDDKTVVIKYFLDVSQKEQKSRMEALENSDLKSFYIDMYDKEQNKNYDTYKAQFSKIIEKTNTDYAKWHVINAEDEKYASKETLGIALEEIEKGIERVSTHRENGVRFQRDYKAKNKPLNDLDLTKKLSDKEYDAILKDLEKEVASTVVRFHKENIPTMLVFEGMDAAGKDGAIARLIRYVDPRLYTVHTISAPDESENARNYLWRFYNRMPQDGKMGIFSRSWYGRVMVERVEGFASDNEWERAYGEMLDMEKQFYEHGGLILKYFVVIDKDIQLERFQDRENDVDKQYKITEEDWRNRDKWDKYLEAENEMIDRTNVQYAPWILVEGNDKKYARIKVIKEFLNRAEKFLKDKEK